MCAMAWDGGTLSNGLMGTCCSSPHFRKVHLSSMRKSGDSVTCACHEASRQFRRQYENQSCNTGKPGRGTGANKVRDTMQSVCSGDSLGWARAYLREQQLLAVPSTHCVTTVVAACTGGYEGNERVDKEHKPESCHSKVAKDTVVVGGGANTQVC